MKDSEILKALKICSQIGSERVPCKDCPYDQTSEDGEGCCDKAIKDAIDLIDRQKEEIEKAKPLMAPCEVGTIVYLIDMEELAADPQNCELYEDVVYEVDRGRTSGGSIKWLCLVDDSGLDFYDTDIGVTAFFDYEAGLQKLSKLCEEKEAEE